MATCKQCGDSLEGRRSGTRFCDNSCRARYWLKRHPARDSRNGRRAGRRNVTNALRQRVGSREPTEYAVYLLVNDAGVLSPLATVLAHDRETAIREVAGGVDGRWVAIPTRAVRTYDGDGRP